MKFANYWSEILRKNFLRNSKSYRYTGGIKILQHGKSGSIKNHFYRWNAKNYDRIVVMATKGKKEEWTKIAKEKGYKGLNGFIVYCIEKELN